MVSFYSTSSVATSASRTFIPFVPLPPKPKAKTKAKPTKTAQSRLTGANSSENDSNWLHVDDFPLQDANASLPALAGVAEISTLTEDGITFQ